MEVLEKLYNCIETNLRAAPPDWQSFASEFSTIHQSDFLLYRAIFASSTDTVVERIDIIATSDRELITKYLDRGMHKLHPYPENKLTMLEPVRRTDYVPDEVFRAMGELGEFLIENGMFYFMNVPALMPDNNFVCIHVWRGEKSPDFTDLEKQRLTLMMRHLLAVVGETKLSLTAPKADIVEFGSKYNLTPTEVEILGSLIEGHSLRTIADLSGRIYGTVRWHVQNILAKCQVSSQKNLLSEFYQLLK